MFDFGRKEKKDQIDYLLKIKGVLEQKTDLQTAEKPAQVLETGNNQRLDELFRRIEALEDKIEGNEEDSARKSKIKNQIISLLIQQKKLSSSELSSLINLSRTRCNEYLKELSREGLTEGVIVGRQKYYKPVRK